MRKIMITTALCAMALAMTTPAEAQGVKFGVKGGFNITEMKFDNATAESLTQMGKDNKNGWYIGPTVKASLAGGLGADAAIFYDQRETKIDGEQNVKQQYIYVPINLRYNIGLGGVAGIYLAAGPQVGFNIGDTDLSWKGALSDAATAALGATGYNTGTTGSSTLETVSSTFQLKKSNFSINLGAGVYLLKFLEVGFVYNIPLGNTADMSQKFSGDITQIVDAGYKEVTSMDVKNNTWQISAAIYF